MDDRELDRRLSGIELNLIRIRDLLDDNGLTEEQLNVSNETFGEIEIDENGINVPYKNISVKED